MKDSNRLCMASAYSVFSPPVSVFFVLQMYTRAIERCYGVSVVAVMRTVLLSLSIYPEPPAKYYYFPRGCINLTPAGGKVFIVYGKRFNSHLKICQRYQGRYTRLYCQNGAMSTYNTKKLLLTYLTAFKFGPSAENELDDMS
jgi:hypothetical protein